MKRTRRDVIKEYPKEIEAKGKFYFFCLKNFCCRFVCWLWVSKIEGVKNIPKEGPFMIVANHQSYFDFMLLTFAFRKIRFLQGFIKDAYFDVPLLNFFLRDLAQIRVDRMNKKAAIGDAIKILRSGFVVVVFPEGTRTKTEGIGKFHRGLGLIGKAMPDVPVIPVGISGANKIWPRNLSAPRFLAGRKVKVSIGNPLRCSNCGSDEKKFILMVKEAVEKLAN